MIVMMLLSSSYCLNTCVVASSKCLYCLKDRDLLELMLIPLVIIGSKYDVFQVLRWTSILSFCVFCWFLVMVIRLH